MRFKILLTFLFLVFSASLALGNEAGQNEPYRKHSIGSSLFLLGNFVPEDNIYAFQVDYGYRFTPKDILIVEGIT